MIVRSRALIVVLMVVAALFELGAQGGEDESTRTRHPIVRHFLTRSDEPLRAYHARRRLEAHNPRFHKRAWLEASTTLDPEQGFRFQVIAEGGSGYIRDRVLRRALETEQQAIATGDTERAAFSDANYTFDDVEAIQDGYLLLRIKPKREDVFLIDGWLLVTGEADLVKIAGRLAKGPSFWTPRVEVRRTYERRSGVRVPVLVESTAHVRIAGRSEFRMTYEYERVNGRPVDGWFDPAGSR